MVSKSMQIQRNDQYPDSRWEKWTLVYPPRVYPSIDRTRRGNDISDDIKYKEDLYGIMRMYIPPNVPEWKGAVFKVLHMVGGRGKGIKVIWIGRVWRDGRVVLVRSKKTGEMIDKLGDPPFELK